MKIKITQLRQAVREIFKEEWKKLSANPSTIPAASSKGEQEFQKDIAGRRWGRSDRMAIPKSDENSKSKRVFNMIAQSGAMSGMTQQDRAEFKNKFDEFMSAKSPQDRLISTAEELADEFMNTL